MDTKVCTNCPTEVDYLDVFPGGLCLTCYAKSPQGRQLPTARQLAQMWGAK